MMSCVKINSKLFHTNALLKKISWCFKNPPWTTYRTDENLNLYFKFLVLLRNFKAYGHTGQGCAKPKSRAQIFLRITQVGTGPKHLGRALLPSQMPLLEWECLGLKADIHGMLVLQVVA